MVTAIKAMPNPVSHTMTHTITTKKLVIPTATAAQEPAKEPVSQKKSLSEYNNNLPLFFKVDSTNGSRPIRHRHRYT
jgi:hypothetical protein